MSNLPTYAQIENWDNDRLMGVISSMESLNYNVPIYGDETSEDRDYYIMAVLAEKERRNL